MYRQGARGLVLVIQTGAFYISASRRFAMSQDTTDKDPPDKNASAQQKQQRKAQQAQDGAKAMTEYRDRELATRKRTARLREERLAREAAEAAAAKKGKR
jgi:hypothetical protein